MSEYPKFATYLKRVKENLPQKTPLYTYDFTLAENRLVLEALKTNTTVVSVECFVKEPDEIEVCSLLADALVSNKKVKNLILGMTEDATYEYFFSKLQLNKTIKKIEVDLPKTPITLNKAELLANFIKNNKELVYIELQGNEQVSIDMLAIESLVNGLEKSKVKTLYLNQIYFTNGSLELLTKFFSMSKNLINLILYDCNVQDADLIKFSSFCKNISKKKIVVLQRNPITEHGMQALATAILENKKLFVHYTVKKGVVLFRFETAYITPYLKRDWKKELKQFYYIS